MPCQSASEFVPGVEEAIGQAVFYCGAGSIHSASVVCRRGTRWRGSFKPSRQLQCSFFAQVVQISEVDYKLK